MWPFIYTILSKHLIKSVNFSYASSAHPAHLHTCRKPVRTFEARPSEPRPSISSSYQYILYISYTLHTILFCKRYAECAEYAETQKSSTEPRFPGASASASPAHPAHLAELGRSTLQQHSSNTPVNEWKIRPKPTSGGAPAQL